MNPKRVLSVRFRKIGQRLFLVKGHEAFELDEVGYQIWNLCDGEHSLDEIADKITEAFPGTDRRVVAADSEEFVASLRDSGLIV